MSFGKSSYNLRYQPDTRNISRKPSNSSRMSLNSASTPSGKPPRHPSSTTSRDSDHVISPGQLTPPNADRPTSSFMAGIAELKDMFAGLSRQLNAKLDFAIGELNAIKEDLAATKKTVTELETSVAFATDKVTEVEKKAIPEIYEKIVKEKEELDTKLTLLEIHDRKQNLLVYGVPEGKNENIYMVIQDLLRHFLNVSREEAAKVQIANAHRLPSASKRRGQQLTGERDKVPDPIIIRFVKMIDRDRLLNAFEHRPRKTPKTRSESQTPARESTNSEPTTSTAPDVDTSAEINEAIDVTSDSTTLGTQTDVPDASQPSWRTIVTSNLAETDFTRVTIRTDLPPALKRERGRLASIAYKLRRDQNVSTRLRLVGAKMTLQTRKFSRNGTQQAPWTIWKDSE